MTKNEIREWARRNPLTLAFLFLMFLITWVIEVIINVFF